MTIKSIKLDDLSGKRYYLTGVDTSVLVSDEEVDSASVIYFVLDGVTYRATEDPDDGYRSCMEDICIVDDYQVSNTFEPCAVDAKMLEGEEILSFTDIVTGEVVLEVGTLNYADYYPCFVSSFTPADMAINSTDQDELLKHKVIRAYWLRNGVFPKKASPKAPTPNEIVTPERALPQGWGLFS